MGSRRRNFHCWVDIVFLEGTEPKTFITLTEDIRASDEAFSFQTHKSFLQSHSHAKHDEAREISHNLTRKCDQHIPELCRITPININNTGMDFSEH